MFYTRFVLLRNTFKFKVLLSETFCGFDHLTSIDYIIVSITAIETFDVELFISYLGHCVEKFSPLQFSTFLTRHERFGRFANP